MSRSRILQIRGLSRGLFQTGLKVSRARAEIQKGYISGSNIQLHPARSRPGVLDMSMIEHSQEIRGLPLPLPAIFHPPCSLHSDFEASIMRRDELQHHVNPCCDPSRCPDLNSRQQWPRCIIWYDITYPSLIMLPVHSA